MFVFSLLLVFIQGALALALSLSVAVLTFWVASLFIHITAAASTRVSRTPGAPARPSGDPADLCVTHSAAQPITAFLLLHDDSTLRTVHRLAGPHQSLQEVPRSPGCGVINGTSSKIVLVLFTIHPFMNCLAEQAVLLVADRAVERVDRVLIHTPTWTVSGGAVITALTARLGH